jgi:meiotic recombination protein DMC1
LDLCSRPERISKIAERFGLDVEETLENIKYAKAYTV